MEASSCHRVAADIPVDVQLSRWGSCARCPLLPLPATEYSMVMKRWLLRVAPLPPPSRRKGEAQVHDRHARWSHGCVGIAPVVESELQSVLPCAFVLGEPHAVAWELIAILLLSD